MNENISSRKFIACFFLVLLVKNLVYVSYGRKYFYDKIYFFFLFVMIAKNGL